MVATPSIQRAMRKRDRARPPPERTSAIFVALFAQALAAFPGCSGDRVANAPAPPASSASLANATALVPPAQVAPPAPAPGRSDPACAAPLDAASSRTQLRAAHGQIVIGVVAGLKDATDENLAHLRGLIAELQRRGAELIIADGDLGDNSEEQEALLTVVTPPGMPVPSLVVAGNREVRSDLDAAEASRRHQGAQLVDLSRTRAVDLGDVLVIGLPGVFERRLLRADGACMYAQSDLDSLATWLDKLPATAPPVMLVAAVPPRGDGKLALDFSDGQNVGDARFIPLMTAARARFGVFGQVWEAGGRALDGQGHLVPNGQLSNQLYVNPGAAERSPWPMNDGSSSTGLAALITIRGRQASYEPIREPSAPARP